MLFFESSVYQHTDNDTEEIIFDKLDSMFGEIRSFEERVAQAWSEL